MGLWQCIGQLRPLDAFAVLVYIIVSLEIDGVESEKCKRKYNDYINLHPNIGDDYDNDYMMYTDCMWGCCYNRETPCCTAPVSLIIGCAIGGILLIALAVVTICCCWVYRRRNRANRAAMERFGGGPGQATSPSVVYHSESSGMVNLPPYAFDEPPSYDEVMRGETNSAFKPDNS